MTAACVKISPFINGSESVLEPVRGCLAQDYDSFQVALVPDLPITRPSDIGNDKRITVITTGDETIARKRNSAIDFFTDAAYFALIDSDAYPDTEWLTKGISFLAGRRDVWAGGGPNISLPRETFMQRVVGNVFYCLQQGK